MIDRPVGPNATLRDVLDNIAASGHGLCVMVDEKQQILGVFTDGDCRRALLRGLGLESPARDAMQTKFIAVDESFTLDQIKLLMRTNGIEQVPIVDDGNRFLRIVSQRLLSGNRAKRPNAALILAGGKGTRLGALTKNMPKPMLPVHGRPMLETLIIGLVEANFQEIYISVNYLAEKIEEYFGDGSHWGCKITYLREETELGSGGPIHMLQGLVKDPFLVVNGDLVTTVDFGSLLEFHAKSKFDITMAVSTYQVQIPFGVVMVNDDSSVSSIVEKPIHWCPVNAGLYVVDPKVIPLVPAGTLVPMTNVLEYAMHAKMTLGAFMIHEVWKDVGLPSVYKALSDGSATSAESAEPS